MDEEPTPPARDDVYEVSDKDYYELLVEQGNVLRWKAEVRAATAELALAQKELELSTQNATFLHEDIVRNITDWGKYTIPADFVLSKTERKVTRTRKE